jgi:energy-coupling factor transporter ATP-binding protein EcfA2
MDLSRRPLLDNARDRRLYVPRGAAARVERSTRDGLNVLVLGERGSGKTTLLRQLALRLREDGVPCAFVDAGLVNDPTMLMKLVRLEVGRSPTLLEALRDTLASPQREIDALGKSGELLSVVRSMRLSESGPDDGRMALLLDGLEAKLAHTVFGRLRDELWQLPFSWVVAGDVQQRGTYLTPPADTFFDDVIELGTLTDEEQQALIAARSGDDRRARAVAKSIRDGNPRALLALAHQALERDLNPQQLIEARVRRETEVSRMGRAASMLVHELEASGPASASDPELLGRMGWTRQRAAQVFAQLQEAGIVSASDQRGQDGRTRKVFTLTDQVVS